MRCDKCAGQLPDYIEGMLSDPSRKALEAHLRECPDCLNELEQLQALDARLRREVPPLWEEIEPTPQFMAQLRRMELEPAPGLVSGIAEWFSSLWGNHRMAMATGLSVCLVIALAFTGVFSSGGDDDDETVASRETTDNERYSAISEAAPTTTQPEEPFDSMTGEGFIENAKDVALQAQKGPPGSAGTDIYPESGDTPPLPTSLPSTTDPHTLEVSESIAGAPGCDADLLFIDDRQPSTILGYTSEQLETAVEIALQDPELHQEIVERGFDRIAISNAAGEDFGCAAITLVFLRDDTCIYACVDIDTGKVSSCVIRTEQP